MSNDASSDVEETVEENYDVDVSIMTDGADGMNKMVDSSMSDSDEKVAENVQKKPFHVVISDDDDLAETSWNNFNFEFCVFNVKIQ